MNTNNALDFLLKKVLSVSTFREKLEILNECSEVQSFIENSDTLIAFLADLGPEGQIAIKSILAVGQGPNVFNGLEKLQNPSSGLLELLKPLLEVEKFYFSIGGLIGYYCLAMKLIKCKDLPCASVERHEHYHQFPFVDISENRVEVQKAIAEGIKNLPQMAEIYPLGGAGDRLDLRDEETGECLPAAFLSFQGISLLEGLINDLQAKEYLHWKLHAAQVVTPVAMMTSEEKNNQKYIFEFCKSKNWFGRSSDSFKTFMQPLVPVICVTGDFSLCAPLKMFFKPGGHGVIWRLAQENGIFSWLENLNRNRILVRQINNPIAGVDYGILAMTGLGCSSGKDFGIASCPRLVNAAEGMLLLVEKNVEGKHLLNLRNVEYTDFKACRLTDIPLEEGSPYSTYPANTNILFVKIEAVKEALKVDPLPGALINLKQEVPYLDVQGEKQKAFGGRVESMMQGIAESIIDVCPKNLKVEELTNLRSFLTYNKRQKTISVTKNQIAEGKSLLETPDSCYFDMLNNCHDLLTNFCEMKVPKVHDLETQVRDAPSFNVAYHPALGPLYKIIGQKIRGGAMAQGAELLLDISELQIVGLYLEGSLKIRAMEILGPKDSSGVIKYSNENGKCELIDVRVINRGVNWKADNCYWKNRIEHHEQLEIIIHGRGEFFAEGITYNGNERFEVQDGFRMEMRMVNGKVESTVRPITSPTWHWKYTYDSAGSINLEKLQIRQL